MIEYATKKNKYIHKNIEYTIKEPSEYFHYYRFTTKNETIKGEEEHKQKIAQFFYNKQNRLIKVVRYDEKEKVYEIQDLLYNADGTFFQLARTTINPEKTYIERYYYYK